MKEDQKRAWFTALNNVQLKDGRWVRGEVVDMIQEFMGFTGYDMIRSMTEDIPQRPNKDQVIDLIVDYTTFSKAEVEQYMLPLQTPVDSKTSNLGSHDTNTEIKEIQEPALSPIVVSNQLTSPSISLSPTVITPIIYTNTVSLPTQI